MTDANGSSAIPAGWYPDPAGSQRERWWDGSGWTEHLQDKPPTAPPAAPAPAYGTAPYGAAQNAAAPNGYAPYGSAPYGSAYAPAAPVQPDLGPNPRINTPFVWVIVLVPLLSAIAFGFFDFGGYLRPGSSPGMMTDPSYLLVSLLSWVIYGVSVWMAYLDHRALGRIGIVRPFHWAWSFLGGIVYVIGRAVVLKRRVGTGTLPAWIMGAVFVVSFIVVIVKVAALVSTMVALYRY
jgi:hypothetical protein